MPAAAVYPTIILLGHLDLVRAKLDHFSINSWAACRSGPSSEGTLRRAVRIEHRAAGETYSTANTHVAHPLARDISMHGAAVRLY